MKKLTLREITQIGLFAALICLLSQFSIPMPYGIPMSLQTFIIPLTGLIIGPRGGLIATIIYVLLGSFGLPVFAGFIGGLGVVLGPTGGFILSFPIMAWLAGFGAKKNHLTSVFFLTLGAICNYILGMLVFSLVTSSDIKVAFLASVLPFIPTTIIKIILVDSLGRKIQSLLPRQGLKV